MTLLRGMIGARRRTSSNLCLTAVRSTPWKKGSPLMTVTSSLPGWPSTMPYMGSESTTNRAIRMVPSLPSAQVLQLRGDGQFRRGPDSGVDGGVDGVRHILHAGLLAELGEGGADLAEAVLPVVAVGAHDAVQSR